MSRKASTALALAAAALLAAPGGGGVATSAPERVSLADGPPYAQHATTACLKRRGAKVSSVQPRDVRLRALRDLAARNSIEATLGKERIGIAFTRSNNNARLLRELLLVPKDPYKLVVRGNVVLMYKPAAKRALAAAVACMPA